MASLLLDEAPAILDIANKLLIPTASCVEDVSTKFRNLSSESPSKQRTSNSKSTNTMNMRLRVLLAGGKLPKAPSATAASLPMLPAAPPRAGRDALRHSWCARSRQCNACWKSSPLSRDLPGSSFTHCTLAEAIIARHQALGSSTSRRSTESNCSKSRCKASKTATQAAHSPLRPSAWPRNQAALTMPRKSSAPAPLPSRSSNATCARRAAKSSDASAKWRRSSPSARLRASPRTTSSWATFRPSKPALAIDSSPVSLAPRTMRRANASSPASANPPSGCPGNASATRAACSSANAGCACTRSRRP
mmetsp:Transcript_36176/g.97948  ORF Transcript_36176/g.97948 Transcript_36176/m.97948 type:complete len:306 (-) Transcript_36176:1101-2018(-)